jgi:glucose-1-phosphate cytidylyltransferase
MGYMIKEYFANYFLHMSDVTFDMTKQNAFEIHQEYVEPWKVTLIDTGENTLTGGRLKRVRPYLGDEDFCFTYGDGVGDIDIAELIAFHKRHGKQATITAVQPPGRFGALDMDGTRVTSFVEKPNGDSMYINGGFFVLSPKCLDLIEGDSTVWEKEPMETLTKMGQLMAYEHAGFWQPMDTLRDKNYLDELWTLGKAPWKKKYKLTWKLMIYCVRNLPI